MADIEELDFESPETCPNCGSLVGDSSACENCGAILSNEEETDCFDGDEGLGEDA